jgi:CRISPR-associated protein (TIGR03984 family)
MLLYVYSKNEISLEPAIQAFASGCAEPDSSKTLALLYGQSRCLLNVVACVGDSFKCLDRSGNSASLNEIFEARIFHEKAELRWLQSGLGFGRAVVLGEFPLPSLADASWELQESPYCGKVRQTYLIWGERESATENGWTTFSTSRIGRIDVPVSMPGERKRAWMKSFEYLKEFEYGNVGVFEERLIGVEVANV